MTVRPTGTVDVIPMDASTGANHVFHAVAFVENLSLKDLAVDVSGGAPHAARSCASAPPSGGDVYIYPFGAIVFRDVPAAERDAELTRLAARAPRPDQRDGASRSFTVREDPGSKADVVGGRADARPADARTRDASSR